METSNRRLYLLGALLLALMVGWGAQRASQSPKKNPASRGGTPTQSAVAQAERDTFPTVLKIRQEVATRGAETVRAEYQKRAQENPKDPEAQAAFGILCFLQNEFGAASAPLRQAERLNSREPAIYQILGDYYRDNSVLDEAAVQYSKLAEIAPKSGRAWYALGTVLLVLEEMQEAISALKRCTELEPRAADGWQALGNAYFVRLQYPEAQKALEKCLELEPENYIGWSGLGRIQRELGNFDQAEKAYRRALEIRPDRAEHHIGLAEVYLKRKPSPEMDQAATTELQKAIELNPGNPQAHLLLGTLFEREGKNAQALEEVALSLRYNSKANEALYAYGQMLRKAGRESEARAYLERAKQASWSRKAQFLQREVDFNPQKPELRYELACLYQSQKRYIKAVHHFRRVALLEPNATRAHERLYEIFSAVKDRARQEEQQKILAQKKQAKR